MRECRYCGINAIRNGNSYCGKDCSIAASRLKVGLRKKVQFSTTNSDNVQVVKIPTINRPIRSYTKRQAAKDRRAKQRTKNDSFYKSQAWKELRFLVIKKYGRQCMACGDVKGVMHVDHIEPRSKVPSKALDFNNLQVLCQMCNEGKSNYCSTDFRPKSTTP